MTSQMASGQPQAARIARPCVSSSPNAGSSMCTECAPWCTAQVKKIAAVAAPSGLVRSCPVFASGRTIAAEIAK